MLRNIVVRPLAERIADLNVDDGKWRFLSMGAGVQTAALLFACWKRYRNGGVIFADTGAEHGETYDYIDDYLYPFCLSKGIKWYTCRLFRNGRFWKLEKYYRGRRQIPIIYPRRCTEDFKIRPIRRVYAGLGASAGNPVYEDIGFSADEASRMGNAAKRPAYLVNDYPLAYSHITRSECLQTIRDLGFPRPRKSGCDFCPFQRRAAWKRMMRDDPERFAEIVDFEENAAGFPGDTLYPSGPLRKIMQAKNMDDFIGHGCDSGHCFT